MTDKVREYSVFIAGAGECDALRDEACSVFDDHNVSDTYAFNVFDWRKDTDCGNFADFQEQIFKSAERKWKKKSCDILVLILWYEFGEDTAKEYERYIDAYKDSDTLLMACHYNGSVRPLDLDGSNVQQLHDWKKSNYAGWGEISTQRGSIRTIVDYRSFLNKKVIQFTSQKT